jgi:hypothetical protein
MIVKQAGIFHKMLKAAITSLSHEQKLLINIFNVQKI